MKFLILFLLPMTMFSQYKPDVTLPAKQVEAIYDGLQQGEMCADDLEDCKEVAISLQKIIVDLNADIQKAMKDLSDLKAAKQVLQDEKEAKTEEVIKLKSKSTKMFGVGPSVGMGIDGKLYGGVGVQVNILRF